MFGDDLLLWAAVAGRGAALKYLAPYIFRVAISITRIVKVENEQVTCRYQDNKGKRRYCTLPVEEFTVGSASCSTSCVIVFDSKNR